MKKQEVTNSIYHVVIDGKNRDCETVEDLRAHLDVVLGYSDSFKKITFQSEYNNEERGECLVFYGTRNETDEEYTKRVNSIKEKMQKAQEELKKYQKILEEMGEND